LIINKQYIRQRHRRRAAYKQPAAQPGATTSSRATGRALRARVRNRQVLNRHVARRRYKTCNRLIAIQRVARSIDGQARTTPNRNRRQSRIEIQIPD
jgi:hypothetical protein